MAFGEVEIDYLSCVRSFDKLPLFYMDKHSFKCPPLTSFVHFLPFLISQVVCHFPAQLTCVCSTESSAQTFVFIAFFPVFTRWLMFKQCLVASFSFQKKCNLSNQHTIISIRITRYLKMSFCAFAKPHRMPKINS